VPDGVEGAIPLEVVYHAPADWTAIAAAQLARPFDPSREWGQTPLPIPVLGVGAEWGYGAASVQTIRQVASDVKEMLIECCGLYVPEELPVELAGAIMDFFIKSSSSH
jgi:hypothetical protein